MAIEEINILWLDLFDFLSYEKKVRMLSLFGVGKDIRKEFLKHKYELSTILNQNEYNKIVSQMDSINMDEIIESYKKKNITTITLYSEDYPVLLKEISDPPLCLYCKGNTQLLNTTCVGIVGTRKPTDYGKIITKQFAHELASQGVTIVSGLAMGIDAIAHRSSLDAEGNTIAVIAGGLDHIYPACNHALYRDIIENNLVISESQPKTTPNNYLFPTRNRIIAGLSKAVLVTEAGMKSGTLHTKNYALDYNREVFVIPGPINSPESEGTNEIIRSSEGQICTNVGQILDFLNISRKKIDKKPAIQLDMSEQSILNYILAEKKSFQEIADYTNIPPKELNNILIDLQLNGIIEKLAGNNYIAINKNII